jgi:hypothetical protein
MQKQMQREHSTFRTFRVISGLLFAIISLTGAFFLICIVMGKAMQQRELNKRIRRFNRRGLNRLTLAIAGNRSRVYARLKHVGRRSGQQYATPVVARPLGDGFVIPLPYGTDVDWYQNVTTAGTCGMRWNGHDYTLENPELIPPEEALGAYPVGQRIIFAAGGLKQFLLLHQKQEVHEEVTNAR